MPILEPEVNIKIADKAEAEELLLAAIQRHLDNCANGQQIMLKLSLPTVANLYKPLVDDPRSCASWHFRAATPAMRPTSLLSANDG
jgi:fructose-bisphosphate aldolase class I